MAPSYYSRNRYCVARYDRNGRIFLNDRVPFRYRDLPDNRLHPTISTDTLDSLAAKYFGPLRINKALLDPSELWWVIADFQPPIDPSADVSPEPDWCIDPTLEIGANVDVYIPSIRTIFELIFDESRRAEHEV